MIAIIDYGMGNIHSVRKAIESMGAEALVTNKPADIRKCDKVVLPGVGAFGDAVAELEKQGLIPELKEHIRAKKMFLGICLGMHILFEKSTESPGAKGLGIFTGEVKKFDVKNGIKVPHMGWNALKKSGECPLLKVVPDNSYVYFCHSFYPKPEDKAVVAATTDYGIDFASIVWQDNIYGLQFHPEKSQDVGLAMLKNFISLC